MSSPAGVLDDRYADVDCRLSLATNPLRTWHSPGGIVYIVEGVSVHNNSWNSDTCKQQTGVVFKLLWDWKLHTYLCLYLKMHIIALIKKDFLFLILSERYLESVHEILAVFILFFIWHLTGTKIRYALP